VIGVVDDVILSSNLAVAPDKIAIFFILLIVIMIWSGVWKAIALWKSARNKQIAWFVVLCIFNTIGILEILYIAFWQKNKNAAKPAVKEAVKPVKKVAKKK
jgi:predicted Na+-dependent transporter